MNIPNGSMHNKDNTLIISPAAQLALVTENISDLATQHMRDGSVFIGVSEAAYREKYESQLHPEQLGD